MTRRAQIKDRFGRLRDARPGEVVGDGEALIVPAFLADAKPRSSSRTYMIDTPHRPGPVLTTDTAAAALDAKERAYDELVRRSSSAWMNDLNNEQAAALVGSLRRLAGAVETGQGIVVPDPDDDEDDDTDTSDARAIRDAAFNELVWRNENAWRGGSR